MEKYMDRLLKVFDDTEVVAHKSRNRCSIGPFEALKGIGANEL